MKLTEEQLAAIESRGKVIVSASAGSGKTFVMIEKLANAVLNGADLDEILAVTFTKKAAAQMKEKLRKVLVSRIESAGENRDRLKVQLSKISTADVSTIHSFCARLLRKYFYALGINSDFEVISSDDAVARELKKRAMDAVFEELYESDDRDFKILLKCFMKKRSDGSLRRLVLQAHSEIRSCADYLNILENSRSLYSKDGFDRLCADYASSLKPKYAALIAAVNDFRATFPKTQKQAVYDKIFNEMLISLTAAAESSVFDAKPALSLTRKPADADCDKLAGEEFKRFKDGVAKRYKDLTGDFENYETELDRFLSSGRVAAAFSDIVIKFDREYAAVKSEENKLDYNDLEHFVLELLADDGVRNEIVSGYKFVFVDEYQDVNPVQEAIISRFTGETFLVGDVKQAIYGFRGSKSVFFSRKFAGMESSGGTALKLSSNFRSGDGVLDFVNALFADIMTVESCGVDYKNTSKMSFGGLYPAGYGSAHLHIFGKDEEEKPELGVYSVLADGRKTSHTREGLAVLSIVEEELKSRIFDLKSGEYRDATCGDICILTRKNRGDSTEGIVRALLDEGYSVSGAQESNICNLPEVRQMLDLLSLIDDAEQDIPLVTALLSPLGGFTEDELAQIRATADAVKPAASMGGGGKEKKERKTFRRCCEEYAVLPTPIARKLNIFGDKLQKLRELSGILTVGEIIDELLENYGIESGYGAGGEQKVKTVLRLAEEGANLSVSAFLQKIKTGGYEVSAPAPAVADSIKITSMHASKGLEYPIVIIADICKSFKGADYAEIPFDEEYGFAPKAFDTENLIVNKTLLRRLIKRKSDEEELKNELNLFYVACTRAMCRLHILAEELTPYDRLAALDAKRYSDLFDMGKFMPERVTPHAEFDPSTDEPIIAGADEFLYKKIEERFAKPYAHANSVDLPVKSSASAILRMGADEPRYAERKLFGGEGETGAERGIAYHRFMELCDFTVNSPEGIRAQLDAFLSKGLMSEEQTALLNEAELSEILRMPVFAGLAGAELKREQEFLCRLPANEILDVTADDFVLVQGAIDLLAVGKFGVKIIDYKYSDKSDGYLKSTYEKQLKLYKKAASVILDVAESNISTTIVNIRLRRQVEIV